MARKVEKIVSAYGIDIKGNMCPDYTCKVCGKKATACSYIGQKLVQVYTPHASPLCSAYNDDNPYAANYSGTSNTCPTCVYEGPDSTCLYDEMHEEIERKQAEQA